MTSTGSRALDFALGIGEFAPALPKIPEVLLRSRSESQPSEQPHGMGSPFDPIIEQAASKYGLPSNLLRAVIGAESSGNPNAVSNKGATGLMQLMPATAAELGVRDIHDPVQNIMGGAHYLSNLMHQFKGNVPLVLAAYNAGPNAVIKSGYSIPNNSETQTYVPKVLSRFQQYNQQGSNGEYVPTQEKTNWSENLNQGLTPKVQQLINIYRDKGVDLRVVSGYRDLEEQKKIYAQGRTTPGPIVTWTNPEKSRHVHGQAVDLVPFVDGKPNWKAPESFWNDLGATGKQLGLEWGGDWKTKDRPHFQLAAGTSASAPAPTSPGPRMAPPPAGYKAMWLSNGTQLNVPEKMNEKQVADMLADHEDEKFRGAVPTKAFPLQGKTYMVPYNYSDKDAEHALVKASAIEGPGVLNSLWQHSVSGLERTLGRTAKFLGDEKTAREAQRLAEQGDWTTSDVEVEAAKKQGLLPGFGAMARQHLAEPLADIAGQVGPSLGLGALASPFVGPLVGGGLAAATQYPSSVESIKEYGEATGHPVSDTAAKIAGVPYAALTTMGLPLRGARRALGLHGAESTITDLAARGAVEEAQRLVGSGVWNRAKDVARAYAGNVGANTALFEALEAIPRVASGQSPVDPNFETHKKILEQAAWFGAPHALEAGVFGQGRRQSALDRALEHTEARRAQTQARPAGAVEDGFEQATGLPPSARAQREMAEEQPVQTEAAPGIEIGKPMPIEAQVVNDLVEAMRENPDLDQAEFIKARTTEYQAKQQVSEDGLPIHPMPKVKQEVKPDEATVAQEVKPDPKQVLQEYKSLLDTHTPENHEQIVAKHREVVKAYEDVGKTVPKTYIAEPTIPAAPAEEPKPSPLPPQSLKDARVAFAQARDAYKADPTNESLYEAAREAQKVNIEEQIAYKGEEGLPPELSVDIPKPEPKEVPSAVEESEASPPVRSSSAQPEVRPKSRDQTVPSERVEPKRQEVEVAESSHEEPKEVKGKDLETRLKEAVKRKDEEFTIPEEEVNKFSERDKISYYQFQGETLAEIGHHLNTTKQQVIDKIKEHGLPDTSKTVIKTSDARRRYVRALEEAREKRSKEIQAWKEFYEEMTGEEAPPDVYKEKKVRSLIEQAVRQKLDEGESPRSIAKHFGMPYEAFKAMMRKKYGMVLPAKGKPSTQPHTVESLQKALTDTYGSRKPVVDIKSRTEANVDAGTKAFYDTKSKRVTFVHDNLDVGDDIHGLLKHEIGVHAQRLGMKDAEFQGILHHLESMKAKGVKAVEEAYKHVPKDTPEHLRNEEALGYLVQHHEQMPLVRRFMSWLRRLAHKVTGHAGWLKAEDLSEIANKVLKRDFNVESRPERTVQADKLLAKKHDPIIDEIDKAGLTTREEPKNFEETHKEAIEFAKGIKSGFRSEFVDFVEPIAKRVKDLPTMYGPKGMEKLRADMVSYEAENAAGFVGSALQIGAPVINKSRAMMLKRSDANLKTIANYVLKHHKDGDKLFGYQLKYETLKDLWAMAEQDAKDITRLRQEINEAQVKIKHFKQMGKSDTRLRPFEDAATKELKDKQNALALKIKFSKIDSETLKPNLPELTAERTALYEKIKEEHPWMQKALDDTRSMLHGLVDFMEMSGMIDKAKAQNWKSWNYAPLYKALEYLEEEPLFAAGQRNGSTPETLRMIKELKGNMFKSNMLENLHKHHYVTMIPAIINNARHAAVEDMITLDALYKQKESPGLSFDEAMQKTTREMEVHGRSTNTVKVMIKGEERHFKIDDADLLSTLAFSRTAHGGLVSALGSIAALQRGVHLKQPAFWVKQIALEPVYANFMTGLKTLVHPGQAIVNLWKIATGKNVNAKILEQHGIDTGWHDAAGEKSFSFSRLQEPTPYHELIGKQSKLGKARKKLDDIHNSIDESIRTAVYEAALKDGKELGYSGQTLEDFAVTKARNYINFANRGKNQFFNEFRAVTAFSSAAINSLNAIYKNATGHNLNTKEAARVRKIFWTRVAATIPMVVGYELMAQSMGAKNEQDDINKYTTIKLSDSVQIPFAWDIGTFIVGIPRVLTDVMLLNAADANKLTAEQGLKRIAEMVWSNVLPPMAPTAIKAAVEPMANFDFRSWNPIEGAGAQRRLPEYRGKSSSEIGNMMGEVFGWSPKRIDHFNKAMLGWTYDLANKAVEVMEEGYVDKPMEPSKKWKYTGLGLFMPQEMPGVDIIFDAQAKAEQANNSLRDAMKENKPDVVNKIKNDPELKVYRTHAPMFKNMTTVLNNFEVKIARINNRKDITPAARASLMAEERKKKQEYAEKSRQQVLKVLGEFAP